MAHSCSVSSLYWSWVISSKNNIHRTWSSEKSAHTLNTLPSIVLQCTVSAAPSRAVTVQSRRRLEAPRAAPRLRPPPPFPSCQGEGRHGAGIGATTGGDPGDTPRDTAKTSAASAASSRKWTEAPQRCQGLGTDREPRSEQSQY